MTINVYTSINYLTTFCCGFKKASMSAKYVTLNKLKISENLLSFVNNELLKDLSIPKEKFWSGFDKAVHELAPLNKKLIEVRENLQKKIDDWHLKNKGKDFKIEEYKKFLKKIDYLKDEGDDFKIETNEEKNDLIYATNDTEKWMVLCILIFILLLSLLFDG